MRLHFERYFSDHRAMQMTSCIFMQARKQTAISTALHPPKVWEQFLGGVYSIFKRTHLENLFHHINNLHQNIKFTMEEESNGKLENGIREESMYWYIERLHIQTNIYTTTLRTQQVARKVSFRPYLIEPFLLSPIKMT